MPGASSMRGVTGFRIVDAVNGALAQLMPDRVPAAGEGGNTLAIYSAASAAVEPFIYYELVCRHVGRLARPRTATTGLSNPCATAANIPVEVAEAEFPVLIERYGLVADTGGPGSATAAAWRSSGRGVCWRRHATPAASARTAQIHRPYGLAGGGSRRAVEQRDPAPQRRRRAILPPMFTSDARRRRRASHHRMAGGGGWGDPRTRDEQDVASDVASLKLSRRACARGLRGLRSTPYGAVDAVATAAARAELAPRLASGMSRPPRSAVTPAG